GRAGPCQAKRPAGGGALVAGRDRVRRIPGPVLAPLRPGRRFHVKRSAGSGPRDSLEAVTVSRETVAAVLARFGAPASAAAPLAEVLTLQGSDPTASTTIRDPDEALELHVADSLVALEFAAVREARRIADL